MKRKEYKKKAENAKEKLDNMRMKNREYERKRQNRLHILLQQGPGSDAKTAHKELEKSRKAVDNWKNLQTQRKREVIENKENSEEEVCSSEETEEDGDAPWNSKSGVDHLPIRERKHAVEIIDLD